jgi:hypothetical protein
VRKNVYISENISGYLSHQSKPSVAFNNLGTHAFFRFLKVSKTVIYVFNRLCSYLKKPALNFRHEPKPSYEFFAVQNHYPILSFYGAAQLKIKNTADGLSTEVSRISSQSFGGRMVHSRNYE